MGKYRKASHVTYDCRYHIVWITKYRRKILNDEIQERLKTIINGVAKEMYIDIISIGMEEDHVHIYCSIPHSQHIPYVLQILKGRTSSVIRKEYKGYLKKYYWKPCLWAVGYFLTTVGEVNHDTIKRYVDHQGRQEILGDNEEVKL
jgi:putative transposase